jgi:hypothetical protein
VAWSNNLTPCTSFYEGRHTKTCVILEKIRTKLQASLKIILFWLIFRKPKPMILQLFELHRRLPVGLAKNPVVKIFEEVLQISNASTGEGQDRICYVQPDDAIKVIKLHKDASNKQTRREFAFYRNRAWRRHTDYSQLPHLLQHTE